MTTEDAFVRAISDAPEDELNWLAYADWLEEQGDLFGEMLRLRIQMDKLSPTDSTRPALTQRHAILESATGFAAWRDWLRGHGLAGEWQGFLVRFTLDLSRWAVPSGAGRHAIGGARAMQIVESLRSFLSHPSRFTALPTTLGLWANKNEGDEIEFWLTSEVAGELLALPCFRNLNALNVYSVVNLDADAVRVIVTHPNLGRLRSLNLSGQRIDAADAQGLASSPHLANLTDLDLRYNCIGDAGATALAACNHLVNLKKLKLAHNSIGQEGAAALKRRFGDACLLPQLRGAQQPRPGDWHCFECSASNFASRDVCYECRSARPKPRLREGDWVCPDCYAHNFANRQTCHGCKGPRPS